MGSCPDAVKRLIERFNQQSDQVRSADYNEAQLRIDFVNPLFAQLGWDMDNTQGFAEQYREVVHEDRVRVAGTTKAPDYSFRIGGVRKFFLEAKKPFVNLKTAWEPAYQLRRYGWSAKLPVSILTDFEELAIYDCRVAPKQMEAAKTARREYITYTEFCKRWDFLEGTFSKRAILTGDFDRYCATKKGRGAEEFDEAFLVEIEQWRKKLASNLALHNDLSEHDLNFATQRIIDRIIFLRICEDRGVEPTGHLHQLLNGEKTYARLTTLFREADARYNSGLFHFKKEARRDETPDELTLDLTVDDAALKSILRRLYYPESPYEFTVVSADILGSVYERFLGNVIERRGEHSIKVVEKPEVRKAGGVYYTPAYIVDYIVKQTVGKLLEGKTPKEAAKLKILDPACGSGSFLLGAYQYLIDWHLKWYVKDGPQKHSRGKDATIRPADKPAYTIENAGATPDPSASGHWALTTHERKRILLDNIHGVDIDYQAVEVTKLSLLLRCLEGETAESLRGFMTLFRERALPDLGHNIQCGNSLIGTDIMSAAAWREMSEEERRRINPFDYKPSFRTVFKGDGGFDAVIGNPPWGAALDDASLAYLRTHYERVIDRMVDTYIYLIDRGIQLKRGEGLLGFIVPATVLNQVDATQVRRLMLAERPQVVVGLGKDIFTKKVLNTSAIITLGGGRGDKIVIGDLASIPLEERAAALPELGTVSFREWAASVSSDPSLTFQLAGREKAAILTRLRGVHQPMSSYLIGSIERGVSPDVAAAHVISDVDASPRGPEPALLRRSISGPRIGRYRLPTSDQSILYTTRSIAIAAYPRARAHLKRFEADNTCREVLEGRHPVWALHRPRKSQIFDSPKFIGLTTTKTIEVIYDADKSLCVTDAMYVFKTQAQLDYRGVLAVVSSKLFLFLYRVSNMGEARVIPQVKAAKLEPLPFPDLATAPSSTLARVASLVDTMLSLHKKLSTEQSPQRKEQIQREIDATDRTIDQLVYQLYGLTKEEIAIVEAATA